MHVRPRRGSVMFYSPLFIITWREEQLLQRTGKITSEPIDSLPVACMSGKVLALLGITEQGRTIHHIQLK